MNATVNARLQVLERAQQGAAETSPLVIIRGAGRDDGDLVAVTGLDHLPRLAHETGAAFVARLQSHVGQTRTGLSPFIGIGCYDDDPE
jgi:hypothetical protein